MTLESNEHTHKTAVFQAQQAYKYFWQVGGHFTGQLPMGKKNTYNSKFPQRI